MAGVARLVHPFPSALDAAITTILAAIAGAPPGLWLRLGASMLAIQFGIGAVNDLVDADRDVGRTDKPIATGIVTRSAAQLVAVPAFAVGLGLAATVSVAVLGVAVAGALIGVVYDLRLKGTAWSWLGFALGLPLLPVFAWVGVTGSVPAPILIAAVAAVPAGFALAVANASPDVERDRAAGAGSVVIALGRVRAWRLAALAELAVAIVSVGSFLAFGGLASPIGTLIALAMAVALGIAGGGLALGRRDAERLRQRGWELQTIGVGALAAAWTAGLAAAGRL